MQKKSKTQTDDQLQFKLHQSLFDKVCDLDTLRQSFKAVKKNKGAPGIDGVSIEDFEKGLDEELTQLKHDVESWKYKPSPVRRVEIPKPNGGVRMLGIATVKDRVFQGAIKMVLEPLLDPEFSNNSYGFRPGRNQKQAVQAAQAIVGAGKEYVVDIDLSKFFDRINHDRLIQRLSLKIEDKRILRLIGMALRSGVMADGVFESSSEGSPQGSPLSPLLSNVVLDELDKELERRGLSFCRFADDQNIFVGSQKAAERVMKSITKFIETKLKLKINEEKSKVARSKFVKFLGMTVVGGAIAISLRSMEKARERVVELTPRGTHIPIEKAVEQINRWYRGWAEYHSMTQFPSQLAWIEAHLRRRLRARIVRQQKKKRHLVKKLVKRGIPKFKAARTVYRNGKTWTLSHTWALERAYPNNWFTSTLKQAIYSTRKLTHWHDLNVLPALR